MRVKYIVPLEHKGRAPENVCFTVAGRSYRFLCTEEKARFLEVQVPSFPIDALPSVEVDEGEQKLRGITLKEDPVWPAIERDLAVVQGVMAMYGLDSLNFEEREVQWIPESDYEEQILGLRSFKRSVEASKDELPVLFDMFARALIAAPQLHAYELALDFYRRGRADLVRRWYIDAFYDFYFVLETLFAGGAFKSKEVKARMLKSELLMTALSRSLNELSSERQFLDAVSQSGRFNYIGASVEKVVEHLIGTRGYLHHHSSSGRETWSPRKQGAFRADAAFLATVCLNVLSAKCVEVMFSTEVSSQFASVEMTTDAGKHVRFVPFEMD